MLHTAEPAMVNLKQPLLPAELPPSEMCCFRTKWQLHAAWDNCVLPATAGTKDILGMQSSD